MDVPGLRSRPPVSVRLKTPIGERRLPVHGRSCQPLNPFSDHHELTWVQQPAAFSQRWKVFSSVLRLVETATINWVESRGTLDQVVGPMPGTDSRQTGGGGSAAGTSVSADAPAAGTNVSSRAAVITVQFEAVPLTRLSLRANLPDCTRICPSFGLFAADLLPTIPGLFGPTLKPVESELLSGAVDGGSRPGSKRLLGG